MSHTPGPWKWTDHGVGEIVVYEIRHNTAVCILDDSDKAYAWPQDYSVSNTAKANADLMAVAPEMHDFIATLENDDGKIPDWLWEKRNEILAKATGKEK